MCYSNQPPETNKLRRSECALLGKISLLRSLQKPIEAMVYKYFVVTGRSPKPCVITTKQQTLTGTPEILEAYFLPGEPALSRSRGFTNNRFVPPCRWIGID